MPPRHRRHRRRAAAALLALLAVAALAALPVPAAAQDSVCQPPGLTVAEAPDAFEAGASQALRFIVENPNDVAAEATLRVETPPGWTAGRGTASAAVGPQNATTISVALTAPARGAGDVAGEVSVRATLRCTVGILESRSAPTDVAVAVSLAEPVATPWLLGLLGAVVLVVGGLTAVRARSQRRAVVLACDAPQQGVPPGGAASFSLTVANRRPDPDTVRLRVADVPEGWRAFVAVPEVELEPGEERAIWLTVRAPADAEDGIGVAVAVDATPARGGRGDRRLLQAVVDATAEATAEGGSAARSTSEQ